MQRSLSDWVRPHLRRRGCALVCSGLIVSQIEYAQGYPNLPGPSQMVTSHGALLQGLKFFNV